MKAINLCKRLLDGWIDTEQAGMMTMFPTEPTTPENWINKYCEGYFGLGKEDKWNGKRYAGEVYFYMYIHVEDEESAYRHVGELPDAYCIREKEQDIVALWRVE